jgi:FKBP-type peptidyl-prolyl cis-trans isomerase 2/SAM-dependent methyltransferase
MSFIPPDDALHSTAANPTVIDRIEKGSILDASVAIHWQSQDCSFSDWRYVPNINLWRDYLPAEIESQLAGLSQGARIKHSFQEGELVESYQQNQVKRVSLKQFQPESKGLQPILPMPGRFYPKDFFTGIDGIYQGNKFPCRITTADNESITIDLNHPLAGKKIDVEFKIHLIKQSTSERGGRCNDIPALLCDYGPGMQAKLEGMDTEFRYEGAFSRIDESDDAAFFSTPDFDPFWDSTALGLVSSLYDDLLSDGMHVLDLMAGAHSPLQNSNIQLASLSCAGLNPQELDANPICTQSDQVNANEPDALAIYGQHQFDAVLIHAAIEYVTQPDQLMSQIARILKPGGRIIISFSNRTVTEKAVKIWTELHEFERPALVLSYLQHSNAFCQFNSFSMRGLFRPEDDLLSDRLLYSDPVYAIWADKK